MASDNNTINSSTNPAIEAFAVAGIITVALICLVLLRFIVFFLIDVCILGEASRALRQVADTARQVSPWRRRPPRAEPPSATESVEVPMGSFDDNNHTLLMKQLLPCRVMSELELEQIHTVYRNFNDPGSCAIDDITNLKTAAKLEDSASSEEHWNSFSCSICLQEFIVGDRVFRSECNHWFHADCIRQWVVRRTSAAAAQLSGNNHCPNCRTELLPEAALDEALQIMRRQHELAQQPSTTTASSS